MQETSRTGDPRSGDRRQGGRRVRDRRAPPPLWRRPWAYVTYGVVGALALVLLLRPGGGGERAPQPAGVQTVPAAPGVDATPPPAADRPVQDAFGAAGFARLVAQGQGAVGQRVRTDLYCGPIDAVTLHDVQSVNRSIAEVADANGRVPAAECEWAGAEETARENFWLLVPPALAERFASAPMVTRNFTQRRHLRAEVEWIGRSEALALRMAGVLRSVEAR